MARERRWIVLVENGEHSTVGRHTDPEAELLDTVAGQLRGHGVGGWLAVMEGDYHGRDALSLLMVRELVPAARSWGDAEAAFLEKREKASAA
jgi:hypothetical protein